MVDEEAVREERRRICAEAAAETADLPVWDTKKQIRTLEEAEAVFSHGRALAKAGGGVFPSNKQYDAANRIFKKHNRTP